MHLLQDGDIGTLLTHSHPCSIYESDEELRAQYVPFLQRGLVSGERCLFFLNEGNIEDVYASMQVNGFDLAPYLAKNAFEVIHCRDAQLSGGCFSQTRMVNYWHSVLNDSRRDGFNGLRAVVQMTWALSEAPGCEVLAQYEASLNSVVNHNKVAILCAYNRKLFSSDKLRDTIHVHPLVITGTKVLENPLMIPAEKFSEGAADLHLQSMLDALQLVRKLNEVNLYLRQQEQRYQELYEELHALARTVSHELQEPINVVISYLRLLSVRYTDRLGEDADEFISRSVAGAKTVARMIDDLWVYSRIDSRPHEQFECRQVLADIMEELKDELKNSQITCSKLPSLVACREHVKYVFSQLLQNANKFAGSRPHIYVSALESNRTWQFAVSDNGPGIDPLYSNDVFQIFNRLGKRPDESGSGMGLAIARRMIEHHSGKIWFQSKPGNGTTFYFTLPSQPSPCLLSDDRKRAS